MLSHSNIISRYRQIGKTQLIMDFDAKQKLKEQKLKTEGWTVECWSPFEIRHNDGSFATGQAAHCVAHDICHVFETEDEILDALVETGFPEGHPSDGDRSSKLFFLGVADMLYDELVYVRGIDVDAIGLMAMLAKKRCLAKAPKGIPQIQWPTGIPKSNKKKRK